MTTVSCPIPRPASGYPEWSGTLQVDVIEAGPHGIAWTHADQVNSALLKFMA
jgi:hypothetical protein